MQIRITQKSRYNCNDSFVIPERFERSTHALEGRCSIQLSYGTDLKICGKFSLAAAKIVLLLKNDNKKEVFFEITFV